MTKKMKGFLVGLLMGLVGRAQLPQGKEPVAYLYNGARLPKLPEWDKEAYPYAAVTAYTDVHLDVYPNASWDCYLFVSASPFYVFKRTYSDGDYVFYLGSLQDCVNWRCSVKKDEDPTAWESCDPYPYDNRGVYYSDGTGGRALWSNHDITYDAEGTVYCAASDPVPVYE